MIDVENTLKNYEGWLRQQALTISPSGDQVEDLMQEGRIAMWQSLSRYDPEKGSLASYLTTAAYYRMGSCLKEHRWTGSQKLSTKFVHRVPAVPLNEVPTEEVPFPSSADISYHEKEIRESINQLSPRQRQYIEGRFYTDLPSKDNISHGVWDGTNTSVGAKAILRNKLKHLEEMVV